MVGLLGSLRNELSLKTLIARAMRGFLESESNDDPSHGEPHHHHICIWMTVSLLSLDRLKSGVLMPP